MDNMEKYIDIARGAVEMLKAAGADEAACNVSGSECDEVQAEAKAFNLMRSYTVGGISLTAIKDKRTSSFSVSSTEPDAIKAAVASCMDALRYASPDEFAGVAEKVENKTFRRGVFEPDMAALTKRLVEFAHDVEREYPMINYEITGSYSHNRNAYVNSNGVEFADETGSYDVSTGYMALKEGQTTSFGPGASLHLTDPDIRVIDAGDNRAEIERAMKLLDPKPVKNKFVGTLIAPPQYTLGLFYTLMSIALSDKPVTSGTGRLCNKLGQRVADERVSFGFLPFSKDIAMGERYTYEGYAAEDQMVIENGVLKSYMLSRHGAAKTGLKRMANSGSGMCIGAGDKSIDDIIASTERGILIGRFSGTEPDASGELSGVAKNSFLIEDGKLLYPTVETMMSANLFDMFNNVVAISSDTVKNGNYVAPYMAFNGVTIK